jgi:hypothetical protein
MLPGKGGWWYANLCELTWISGSFAGRPEDQTDQIKKHRNHPDPPVCVAALKG